jgi:hypothetical protein
MRRSALLAATLLAWASSACSGDAPANGSAAVVHPERLEDLAKAFQDARAVGDMKRLGALYRSMVPTTADLRRILRAGPATEDFLAKFPGKDAGDVPDPKPGAVGLFSPGDPKRAETRTYSATTEEIVAYAKGTVAFEEFPGGMRRFASAVAAPGRTWWVVVIAAPGERGGMKYSTFTRLDDRWLVVVKPWNWLPREAAAPAEDGK